MLYIVRKIKLIVYSVFKPTQPEDINTHCVKGKNQTMIYRGSFNLLFYRHTKCQIKGELVLLQTRLSSESVKILLSFQEAFARSVRHRLGQLQRPLTIYEVRGCLVLALRRLCSETHLRASLAFCFLAFSNM